MGLLTKLLFWPCTIFLLGVAPEFYFVFTVWRVLSLLLPNWVYQMVDDLWYATYQRLVLFFYIHMTGVEVYFNADIDKNIKKNESVFYIANHVSNADWILTNVIAVRCGALGHLRFVIKHSYQMIPLYGHYFYQHGSIFVKRGQFAADKMLKGIDYLKDPNIISWPVVFPEGTRFKPNDKHLLEKSEQAAVSAGLPVLKYHLSPRSRGAWLILQEMRSKLDAVYDITTIYDTPERGRGSREYAPQLQDFLRGKCNALYFHVRRFPISEVPTDEKEFQKWMHSVFVTKDKIVSDFYDNDVSTRERVRTNYKKYNFPLKATLPSFIFFFLVTLFVVFTPLGRSLYFMTAIFGTLSGYAWLLYRSVC